MRTTFLGITAIILGAAAPLVADCGGPADDGPPGGAAGSGGQDPVDATADMSAAPDTGALRSDAAEGAAPDADRSDGTVDVGPAPPPDGPTIAIADACAAHARAYCARFAACASVRFHVNFGDVATCEARTSQFCPNEFTAAETTMTPRGLASCAEAIVAQSCPEWLTSIPSACVWLGRLSDGDGCEYDSQCQSGFCSRPVLSWCGVCRPRFKEGETCVPQLRSCEMGLLCGGFCQQNDAGTCTGTVWRCVRPAGEGTPCTAAEECARGLICLQGQCTLAKQQDEPCRASSDCDTTKDLSCTMRAGSNLCSPVSYASAGQACNYLEGRTCSAQGTCIGPTGASANVGTCGAIAADGQACDSLKPCLPPVLCVSGVCKAPVVPSSCP